MFVCKFACYKSFDIVIELIDDIRSFILTFNKIYQIEIFFIDRRFHENKRFHNDNQNTFRFRHQFCYQLNYQFRFQNRYDRYNRIKKICFVCKKKTVDQLNTVRKNVIFNEIELKIIFEKNITITKLNVTFERTSLIMKT